VIIQRVEAAVHAHDDLTEQILSLVRIGDATTHERAQTFTELRPNLIDAQ